MRKLRIAALVTTLTVLAAMPALAGGRPFQVSLESANEVPPAASSASGTAWLTLNQGQGEVCVTIESGGFEGDVIAGHIHVAPEGVNGPVVVNLGVNSANYSACVEADRELIKDIRQNPADYYINVHSTVFPGGEVRGQLSK